MSYIHFALALQPLRGVASGAECKLMCARAQKLDAATVSDAHEKVRIQGERVSNGKNPATAAVVVTQLDLARRARDEIAQFLTFKHHAD
jgi:hypothetical protein